MYQKILVPLDGSPVAEQAIPYALELCRLSDGQMVLAQVIPSAIEPPARYSMAEADIWLLRQAQIRREVEAYLAQLARQSSVAGAETYYHVIAGEVGEGLLALIEREQCDVLVMTTRRRRKVARYVLGSVVDFLVQRAPIPVLLVRQNLE